MATALGAPDDSARAESRWASGGAAPELDMLLEFTDALAADIPALRSPAGAAGGISAFSQSPGADSPARRQVKAVGEAEARRERLREKERRKYHRKKARLEDLRRQVAALERQLRALSVSSSAARPAERATAFSVRSEPSGAPETTEALDRETLQVLVADLARTKTRLRNENTQLRWQFRRATQHASFVSDLLFAEFKLYSAHASHFRLLRPLSVQTCLEIHDQAVEIVHAFSQSIRDTPPVGSVSGWRERRVVDGPFFKFALEKTFPRMSAKFACFQTWAVLVDPSRNRRLYSDVLDVRVRFVQKIDDDNLIFLEEMRTMDPGAGGANGGIIKSAVLLSRFAIENGFRIHMRALDREQIEMEDLLEPDNDGRRRCVELPNDLWNSSDQLTWLQFEDRDSACVVSFAGMTPTIGANAYFWMTEVILLCLRCEAANLGQRFFLPK